MSGTVSDLQECLLQVNRTTRGECFTLISVHHCHCIGNLALDGGFLDPKKKTGLTKMLFLKVFRYAS